MPLQPLLARSPMPVPTTTHANSSDIITQQSLAQTNVKPPRPCDACRRRKSKCMLNSPGATSCMLCTHHNQSCTFLEDPVPRKKKPPAATTMQQRSASSRAYDSHNLPLLLLSFQETRLEIHPANRTTQLSRKNSCFQRSSVRDVCICVSALFSRQQRCSRARVIVEAYLGVSLNSFRFSFACSDYDNQSTDSPICEIHWCY